MKEKQISHYLRISAFQFAPEWQHIKTNIQTVVDALDGLDEKPDVFVLPEMFSTGFTMDSVKNAETMQADTFEILKNLAKENDTAICGSMAIRDKAAYYNRFVFIHPNGEINHYDKRHLFTMAGEKKHYNSGNSRELIMYKGWRIFPSVCYDIRFPVWCRNNLNYDILINVANWPAARTGVWQTLLQARAIENQCFVVGVNRVGNDENGVDYLGESRILDAKGMVLESADDTPKILTTVLDKYELESFREKFPVLKDSDSFQIF